jgi:hypothetical protein
LNGAWSRLVSGAPVARHRQPFDPAMLLRGARASALIAKFITIILKPSKPALKTVA